MLLIIFITIVAALLVDAQRDRWPPARRLAVIIVGFSASIIAIYGIMGIFSDVIDGRTSQITRAGSRSVFRKDSQPIWFWCSIALKLVAGAAFLGAGLGCIGKGFSK